MTIPVRNCADCKSFRFVPEWDEGYQLPYGEIECVRRPAVTSNESWDPEHMRCGWFSAKTPKENLHVFRVEP